MGRTTVTLALFTESTLEDLVFEVIYEPLGDLSDGPVAFSIHSTQVSGPVVNIENFPEIIDALRVSARSHYFRSKLN